MTKRLIDIDDELLREAREALGTRTIKDTVTGALEQTVRSTERRTHLTEAALGRFASAAHDLADEEVMNAAWR
jgi:Arc/MetJ family transcription regulator